MSYIVMATPQHGGLCYGPFSSQREAVRWALAALKDFWVVELYDPIAAEAQR